MSKPTVGTFTGNRWYDSIQDYIKEMVDDKCGAEFKMADSQSTDLAAEIERLREMIGEAYQVIGALAHYTGTKDHPDVIRALDNFATGGEGPVPHPDLLPWPKMVIKAHSDAK